MVPGLSALVKNALGSLEVLSLQAASKNSDWSDIHMAAIKESGPKGGEILSLSSSGRMVKVLRMVLPC